MGHLLDYLCGVYEDEQLRSEYNSMSAETVKKELSDYATSSINEYIAEGYAEYMSSSSPRAVAKSIKEAIARRYQCV